MHTYEGDTHHHNKHSLLDIITKYKRPCNIHTFKHTCIPNTYTVMLKSFVSFGIQTECRHIQHTCTCTRTSTYVKRRSIILQHAHTKVKCSVLVTLQELMQMTLHLRLGLSNEQFTHQGNYPTRPHSSKYA